MTTDELALFLADAKVAEVAGHSVEGMTARRADVKSAGPNTVVLDLIPRHRVFELDRDDRICVISDRYPDHDAIQGLIMEGRGHWVGESATLEVAVERVTSFDFRKAGRRDV